MTREDFIQDWERLCAGFNVPLTEARSDAMYRRFSVLSANVWRSTVDKALGLARMPEADKLLAISEAARDDLSRAAAKKIVCECGGQLDLPTKGPQGCHVVDEPLDLDAMGQVYDRRDRPDRWGSLLAKRLRHLGLFERRAARIVTADEW